VLRGISKLRKVPMIAIAVIGLATLLVPPLAFSQSCALCYTQAASAGARMIQALRSGILILIVPPTFMSVCMIFVVRSKSDQFSLDQDEDDSNRDW
jgi:hypothetical protein